MMAEQVHVLVSVVIVTYNGRKFLKPCLDSVLDQTFPQEQYEVFVVDNASRDGSADFVAENYPTVNLLRFKQNFGPNEAILYALAHRRGKYLAYLNQDTIVHRHWLAELVNTITTHPRAGLVESNMILPQWAEYQNLGRDDFIDRAYVCDITSYGTHDFRIEPVTATTPPIPVLTAYGAGCIINPQIIDHIGYLVEPKFFAYGDDLDIGLRINAAGYQVLLAPRSVVYHDTDWHFKWNMRSIRRAFWATRNTILAFYKVSYATEFLVLLPRLLIGKSVKAGQHCQSRLCKMAYGFASLPLLLISFVDALRQIPAYYRRRKLTLSYRKMRHGWLTARLLNPDWQSDPGVWNEHAIEAKEYPGKSEHPIAR